MATAAVKATQDKQARKKQVPRPMSTQNTASTMSLDQIKMQERPVIELEPEVRMDFLRKVYGILSMQLLATVLVAAIFVANASLSASLNGNIAFFVVMLFLPIILLVALYYKAEDHPTNIVLASLFTLTFGILIGVSSSVFDTRIVFQAVLLTLFSFAALTAVAFKSGVDFSFLHGFLVAGTVILVIGGLLQLFFPVGGALGFFFACFGALVFSGWILYDTQAVMERHTLDQALLAAIALYVDVCNLYFYLLRALAYCQQ